VTCSCESDSRSHFYLLSLDSLIDSILHQNSSNYDSFNAPLLGNVLMQLPGGVFIATTLPTASWVSVLGLNAQRRIKLLVIRIEFAVQHRQSLPYAFNSLRTSAMSWLTNSSFLLPRPRQPVHLCCGYRMSVDPPSGQMD
jgi:hypothetical protein